MAGAALLLGILLLILISGKPLDKPLFSRTIKIVVGILALLSIAFIIWLAFMRPEIAPRMIGQFFGALILVLIFVGAGEIIRKRRFKKVS